MKKNQQATPPRWAERLLRWYCAPHLLEEIQGDLDEEFYYQLKHNGLKRARRDYIRSVFNFMKPFAIQRKPNSSNPISQMKLLRHYFVVALRNVTRQKTFSAINVVGLALGMTCCIAIFVWVIEEWSVDNFHSNGKNLYTVYMTVRSKTGQVQAAYNAPLGFDDKQRRSYCLFEDAKTAIPEVVGIGFYATGYGLPWGHPETFQVGDKLHKLEGSRASEDFFSLFDYPVIAGDKYTALNDLSDIAISRKMATLFFGNPDNAIGKSIRYENRLDFQVSAVFEDVTAKSSMQFDFLINWKSHETQLAWSSNMMIANLLVTDQADVKQVTEKLNRLVALRLPKDNSVVVELGLQPFRDQYLRAHFENGKPASGRVDNIRIFVGVAIFILVIACINFMNLATARSVKRAKEVGVRKAIGSPRSFLIAQFFGESMLLAFLAMALSLVLLQLVLPLFSQFTGRDLPSPLTIPVMWLALPSLAILTGVLAGSYPAFFLSSLKPARVLKGVLPVSASGLWVRRSFSTFQFGLSILLLIATVVVARQTRFMQEGKIGYDKENLFYFSVEGELAKYEKYVAFKNAVEKMPGIRMVDRSSEAPHSMAFLVDEDDGMRETANNNTAINWEGREKGKAVGFKPTSVGFDFVQLMNLEVVEGRNFSRDHPTDSADAFIVNEAAVKEMGIKDPIGKWVSAWSKKGHIIGILKDYNTNSLHERIRPIIVDVKEYEQFGVILVRTEAGKTQQALSSAEKIYKSLNPNYPFDFRFVDEEYNKMYRSEQVIARLSEVFSVLAILISCLGLLGLVMFTAEQRVKEIGIRKVLGATVINIVGLLSKDFLKLVAFSFLVAAPIAGYVMYRWLQGFAYQIELSWWIFVLAGVATLLVALVTISVQALQSAAVSPVQSLKAEG